MIEAYKKFWKGYVDFEGRSTRPDYKRPFVGGRNGTAGRN